MEKDHRGTIVGASFSVADIQQACLDLLERSERCARSTIDALGATLRGCAAPEPTKPKFAVIAAAVAVPRKRRRL